MAACKYPQFLQPALTRDFDAIFAARTMTPVSGIYRCEACGCETVAQRGAALPGPGHHPHHPAQGLIRWRLIVEVNGGYTPPPQAREMALAEAGRAW